MRVASPFNDYSKDSLNLYRVIDTQVSVNLVGRVRGANFASIYWTDEGYGISKCLRFPEGHHGNFIPFYFLDTLPARIRNNYIKKFNTSIHFWRNTGGGLDEDTIQELLDQWISRLRETGVSIFSLKKKSRNIFYGENS